MGYSTIYNKTVLPNGIRITTEYLPGVRSISLGVWIWSGTRFEQENQCGIAHFLEHMVFKGTKSRNSFQIAQSIESLGGYINAFTGKELNCYFVRTLDEHLPVAVDVLGDILMASVFDPIEIEKEKGVVIEEIHGLEDNPVDLANEFFSSLVWDAHPLGRPILGTTSTVESFNQKSLYHHLQNRYHNNQIYIIAAGQVDHSELVDLVSRQYDFPMKNNGVSAISSSAENRNRIQIKTTDHAQVQMCVGGIGLPYHDSRKYAMYILNTALGGGMTSRLFQKIREEAGLAYAVYSDVDFCIDTGLYCINAGADPHDISRVLEMIQNECNLFISDPVSDQELRDTKSQLIGSLYLSLEGTTNVMNRLARMEMYGDNYITVEEIVSGLEKVTARDIQSLAEFIFIPEKLILTAVGPITGDELSL